MAATSLTKSSFLDRERTVAPPGFNRWLVPPAALAVHLAVGQVYAYSVFSKPLGMLLGGKAPGPGDWTKEQVGVVFSIAIVFLGLSAALFGKWLEAAGPRKAMVASALCFSGGFFVGAAGIGYHHLWLLYLGYGVLGGIGLGLGYISPVSTLIKWFPDRPGLATGLAIMGFGGGAMIAAPLSVELMKHYKTATSSGVAETFLTLGVIYFAFILFAALIVRVPPATSEAETARTGTGLTADQAIKTPQFWLLWAVLFLNVTAGISILSVASPMIQDVFRGRVSVAAAAGFVGLLSLFNLAGRFGWSTLSDKIGRKATYTVFFILGALLYVAVPLAGRAGSIGLFVAACVVILSMYGGGFATIPAYLRDRFGSLQVGAIHGRLLTAWSAAGIVGPFLIAHLLPPIDPKHPLPPDAYDLPLHVMAGLLVLGLVCNLLVRPSTITPQPEASHAH